MTGSTIHDLANGMLAVYTIAGWAREKGADTNMGTPSKDQLLRYLRGELTIGEHEHQQYMAEAAKLLEGKADMVNSPSHYMPGQYEVYKVLRAWGLEDDALLWDVVKYVARARRKGKELEDLEKAEWYLREKIRKLR